jgi:RimJ/RimL family protein N-acetyltransferase
VTGEAVVVAAHVRRLEARWVTPIGALTVAEPDGDVLAAASDALAAFYNEPHNAALLSNTLIFSPDDVLQFWADSAAEGGHSFLLRCDEELVGDADFRNVTVGAAEVAILIGVRGRQGQGLGGRFLSMVLAIGFGPLGLDRVYAAIRPNNAASLRVFDRAGFVRDESPAGRAYAEADDDVCLVLARAGFGTREAEALREIALG